MRWTMKRKFPVNEYKTVKYTNIWNQLPFYLINKHNKIIINLFNNIIIIFYKSFKTLHK